METKTGYVHTADTKLHRDFQDEHHVEGPNRTDVAHTLLTSSGLLENTELIENRRATKDELLYVHTENHLSKVANYRTADLYSLATHKEWRKTYICDDTYSVASLATGCLLNLVQAVCEEQIQNGLAVVRPPGHHAQAEKSAGFCYFNSVAIAARYAQYRYKVNKVAIVDWDVHHGDGLQAAFYDDPNVLYISLHRYDHAKFFPASTAGNYDHVGGVAARGYNMNIPWNDDTMGDAEYRQAFKEIILPVLEQFAPDLLLVACGFDAAAGDPLGQYNVTSSMYGWMTKRLMSFAGGKVVLSLEGGYQPTAIGAGAQKVLEALMSSPEAESAVIDHKEIGSSARETLDNVKTTHGAYWKFQA